MVPRSNNIAALPSAPPRRDGVVLLLHPLSFHAHTPLLQSQLSLQVLTAPTPPPTPVPGLSGLAFVAAGCWLLSIHRTHLPFLLLSNTPAPQQQLLHHTSHRSKLAAEALPHFTSDLASLVWRAAKLAADPAVTVAAPPPPRLPPEKMPAE
jgi:hypothetical protein